VNQKTSIPVNMYEEHIPFIHLLDKSERETLYENSNIVRLFKKDIIFRQSTRTSHIMIVFSGLVKIFKEGSSHRQIILKLALPGNYIGLLSVMGDQIHQYSASAVEDSDICFIDINAFRNIILENGKFGLKLLGIISQEGLYIFKRLLSQTQKQLPGRIADVLLYFSHDVYNSSKFTLPLTRRELAELAGTTKESFIRTLTEFKNDKIILLNGSEVEIVSNDIIITLSEFG
jgi:CRP/FNR family transcriptional regulator, polysaccharide utilization system transcription regulator